MTDRPNCAAILPRNGGSDVARVGRSRAYDLVMRLPIALYILGCAVIGIVATALLTDHTNKDISAEYEAV